MNFKVLRIFKNLYANLSGFSRVIVNGIGHNFAQFENPIVNLVTTAAFDFIVAHSPTIISL